MRVSVVGVAAVRGAAPDRGRIRRRVLRGLDRRRQRVARHHVRGRVRARRGHAFGRRSTVGNYQTLPEESWFNLWFDLDRNSNTGDPSGDEALVRFLSEGGVEHYLWNGSQMAETPATGMTGSIHRRRRTVTIPKTGAFAVSTLGILAVSARGQTPGWRHVHQLRLCPERRALAVDEPHARDLPGRRERPRSGARHRARARHRREERLDPLRGGDPEPPGAHAGVGDPPHLRRGQQDADGQRPAPTCLVSDVGGEIEPPEMEHDSHARGGLTRRRPASGSGTGRTSSSIEVHRSELGSTPRFGFKVASVRRRRRRRARRWASTSHRTTSSWWRYTLANPAAVRLLAGEGCRRPGATPARSAVHDQRPRAAIRHESGADRRERDLQGRRRREARDCARQDPCGQGPVRAACPEHRRHRQRLVVVRSAGATVTSRFSFRVR